MDYIIRQKVTTNITKTFVEQLPIPVISNTNWFFNQLVSRSARLICILEEFSELWNNTYDERWKKMSIDEGGTSYLNSWSETTSTWTNECGLNDLTDDKRDKGNRSQIRAEIDALVAHLYGLSKDEFAYILDTFPVLKKNEEAVFGEFQSKRKCLEEYERLKPIIEEERKKHPEQFEINEEK